MRLFYKPMFSMMSNYNTQTYFSLVIYLFLAMALCGVLATLAYLFSLSSAQDSEKRSEYECGFEPFDSATRLPFDVHFYLVGILFLIFDVEIALLFPWTLTLRVSGWYGFYVIISFILVLGVGFLYEWKRGALIWPARQRELPYAFVLWSMAADDRPVFYPVDSIIKVLAAIASCPIPTPPPGWFWIYFFCSRLVFCLCLIFRKKYPQESIDSLALIVLIDSPLLIFLYLYSIKG